MRYLLNAFKNSKLSVNVKITVDPKNILHDGMSE